MEIDRLKIFEKELDAIGDMSIRMMTYNLINDLPAYFFEIPASSTGKYHPKYALGRGGLVRHTWAACRIAIELFPIYTFNEKEQSMILSALILHDGYKCGSHQSEYTKHEHPLLSSSEVLKYDKTNVDKETREIIADAIASHMGQWNSNRYSSVLLPTPVTEIQKFVHLCDYLASRKSLDIDFMS